MSLGIDKRNISLREYIISMRNGLSLIKFARHKMKDTILNVKHGIWLNDINSQFNVNGFEWSVITNNRECISFLHAFSKNHILLVAINYYLYGSRRVKINMPDMRGLTILHF